MTHFRPSEFRCPHCHVSKVEPRLVELLERIRALTGQPLIVHSGYRCPEHNAAVGGAKHSQHLLGRAADIPSGRVRQGQAIALGANGVGTSKGWAVHVDVRDGQLALWSYD